MRLSLIGAWLTGACAAAALCAGSAPAQDKPLTLVERQRDLAEGKYAIIVGVDDYLQPEIPDLQLCVADAKALASVLVDSCGYPAANIHLLIGNDASRQGIVQAVQELADPNLYRNKDTIIFYYSGHGLRINDANYLTPVDGSTFEQEAQERNLSIDWIQQALFESGFQRKILLIDACRTNSSAKGPNERGFVTPTVAAQFGTGLKAFYATKPGESSREDAGLGHGLFTYYLLEGLGGKAAEPESGLITFNSLESYVAEKMGEYSLAHPEYQQTPYSLGEGSGAMPLALVMPRLAPVVPLAVDWSKGVREKATLSGHTSGVSSVSFSPDGRYLATGSFDQTAKLWDVSSAQLVTTLAGHTDEVWSVDFSPDGRYLATGSSDGTAKLWEVSSRKPIATIRENGGRVFSVSFSPDGRCLATGSDDGAAKLWEVPSGKLMTVLETRKRGGPMYVLYSSDGRYAATQPVCAPSDVKFWDTRSRELMATIGMQGATQWSMALSRDSRYLALAGVYFHDTTGDNAIEVWDIPSMQQVIALKSTTAADSLCFSPDGRYLAAGYRDGDVRLWELPGGSLVNTISVGIGGAGAVIPIAFSPDGRYLATGGFLAAGSKDVKNRTAKLWEPAT